MKEIAYNGRKSSTLPSVREIGVVTAIGLLASWLITGLLGPDANWDLLNYHYYNGFAFLDGRLDWDIAPAQRQTFFNPLLDVPTYWLTKSIGPWGFSLAAATLQALLAPLAWLLAYIVCGDALGRWQRLGCALLTTLAVLSPVNLLELGTAYADNTTAVLVLAALVLLVASSRYRWITASLAAVGAGLLCGAAAGLKLTNAPYVIGLGAVTLLWLTQPPRHSTRGFELARMLLVVIGLAAGILLTYGFWGLHLWETTGNPLFPQFNHVFKSSAAATVHFVDDSFKADSLLDMLSFPLTSTSVFGEPNYRGLFDLRIALALAGVLALAVIMLVRRARHGVWRSPHIQVSQQAAVVCFFLVSYVLWLVVFTINRYSCVLEIMAPAVVAAVALMIRPIASAVWLSILLLLASIPASMMAAPELFIRPADRLAWGASFGEVSLPTELEDAQGGLILILGGDSPTAFVAPGLSPATRFVRVTGNLYWPHPDYHRFEQGDSKAGASVFEMGLLQRACALVAQESGPVFGLTGEQEWLPIERLTLNVLGLVPSGDCARIATGYLGAPVRLCRLERHSTAKCKASIATEAISTGSLQ